MSRVSNFQQPVIVPWEVGERIRQGRIDNDLTISEVCEVVGVTPQAFDKWQNGLCMPKIEKLLTLAILYNTTLEDLLIGDDERSSSHIIGNCVSFYIKMLRRMRRAHSLFH